MESTRRVSTEFANSNYDKTFPEHFYKSVAEEEKNKQALNNKISEILSEYKTKKMSVIGENNYTHYRECIMTEKMKLAELLLPPHGSKMSVADIKHLRKRANDNVLQFMHQKKLILIV